MRKGKFLIFMLSILVLAGCAEQSVQDKADLNNALNYKPNPPPDLDKPKPSPPPKKSTEKTATPNTPTNGGFYVVQKGDTLYSIGFRTGFGYWKLSEWNNLPAPYTLRLGQKLRLSDPKAAVVAVPGVVEAPIKNIGQSTKTLEKPVISNDKEKNLKLFWQWPIHGTILKGFARTGNKGINIACQLGDPIQATADGDIVYSSDGLKAYGNLIIIKHSENFLSAYGHNESLLVKEGQKVKQGQKIASCGKVASGATALHFEIRKDGKSVNPLLYLPE